MNFVRTGRFTVSRHWSQTLSYHPSQNWFSSITYTDVFRPHKFKSWYLEVSMKETTSNRPQTHIYRHWELPFLYVLQCSMMSQQATNHYRNQWWTNSLMHIFLCHHKWNLPVVTKMTISPLFTQHNIDNLVTKILDRFSLWISWFGLRLIPIQTRTVIDAMHDISVIGTHYPCMVHYCDTLCWHASINSPAFLLLPNETCR